MSEKLRIPESWAEVIIDELLEPLPDGRVLHHGWSPQCEAEPSTSDDEWGVLKTTAVQDGLYLEEHNKRLPASLTPRQHLEVKTGDILITCAGPRNRCGVPCLVRHTRPKLILSGKMYRFRVNESVMDGAFLEGYLRAKDTQTAIDGMKTGISDSGLNLTHGRFFRLKVPVAPLNEQRRIVAKIEELFSDLDAGVAALQRAKANLKRYRAAVLKAAVEGKLSEEWRAKHPAKEPASALLARILQERRQKWEADQLAKFAAVGKEPPKNWREKYVEPSPPDVSRLPQLPDSWCWGSLEQITSAARPICYGILMPKENVPVGVLYVKVKDIKGDRIDILGLHRTRPEIAAEFSRASLRSGDLLLSIRGTYGRVAEVPPELDGGNITQDTARLDVSRNMNLEFAATALRSSLCQMYFMRIARGVAVKGVNIADVRLCPIPICPIQEQVRIVTEVSEKLSQIEAAELEITHSLIRASRLRQSILKQAFEGKLVPQDPNDEPASVLLERLQANRYVNQSKSKPTARPRVRHTKHQSNGEAS